jgi:DNA invertase Pin-like site-specific DNA recombinase
VVGPKLDRMFRSALDALQTIKLLKERGVSLWLLDLGGDVSGNGVSEIVLTILAAVAQFERMRIGERVRDASAHMRRQGGISAGRGHSASVLPIWADQGAPEPSRATYP